MLQGILLDLGVSIDVDGGDVVVQSPGTGEVIGKVAVDSAVDVDKKIGVADAAFREWRDVPAPKRGELVRVLGEVLREHKEPLAQLVTLECGKILEEGRGEVQEMIDICDFAVGLSRQLYGLTIASEREQHAMQETWYPLGVIGVITAFNFPVAVWAWNTALALVCGNAVIWKPSEKTPITALACQQLFEEAVRRCSVQVPEGLSQVVVGLADVGERLVDSKAVSLVSATGSCRMGRLVGPKVQERFGRVLLELGGNNAVIVTEHADMAVALPSILFGAVGTAGQRCTTTRRAFVHRSHYDAVCAQLKGGYESIIQSKIGDPFADGTLVGPLIDQASFEAMQSALVRAREQGGDVLFGGREDVNGEDSYYAQPALVLMPSQTDVVLQETFAPILYVMPYDDLEQVMEWHNAVPQGLSSAIFTTDLREAQYFKQYSDCGIANVNIGTSGAEIGGAFGGEKETGGGRESGSDAWKIYMRRQTSTMYYGKTAPGLAQGIEFEF